MKGMKILKITFFNLRSSVSSIFFFVIFVCFVVIALNIRFLQGGQYE